MPNKTDIVKTGEQIRPSDIVLHKPSGETWVVCGVDRDKDEIVPCGYPFPSLAKLSDCELVEARYHIDGQPEEYINALRQHGLDRFIDVRAAMFYGLI